MQEGKISFWLCCLALGGATLCVFPAPGRAQDLDRVALASFPADTQHFSYTSLSQLRALPNYPLVRLTLPLYRQLQAFEGFLHDTGTDPEKDVNEVVLGWRGQATDTAALFGLAAGTFQTDKTAEYFAKNRLPSSYYRGFQLFAFGSGQDSTDLFFAFISSTLAAFGRENDLKVLLDVRAGARPALDSDGTFSNWEAELEGSSVQWGVARGKAAVNQAIPWLAAGGKVPGNLGVLAGLVQAVLYRVDWSSGFSAHLSVLCQNAETASALAQIASGLQGLNAGAPAGASSGRAEFFQGMEIQSSGSRLELTASAPVQVLDQALREAAQSSTP